jgi:hypothetical protein
MAGADAGARGDVCHRCGVDLPTRLGTPTPRRDPAPPGARDRTDPVLLRAATSHLPRLPHRGPRRPRSTAVAHPGRRRGRGPVLHTRPRRQPPVANARPRGRSPDQLPLASPPALSLRTHNRPRRRQRAGADVHVASSASHGADLSLALRVALRTMLARHLRHRPSCAMADEAARRPLPALGRPGTRAGSPRTRRGRSRSTPRRDGPGRARRDRRRERRRPSRRAAVVITANTAGRGCSNHVSPPTDVGRGRSACGETGDGLGKARERADGIRSSSSPTVQPKTFRASASSA